MEQLLASLQKLSEDGITERSIERALELPFGTIERWRVEGPPPEAVALLRVITTYPWMLDVAEHGFEKSIAYYTILERAARIVAITEHRKTHESRREDSNPQPAG